MADISFIYLSVETFTVSYIRFFACNENILYYMRTKRCSHLTFSRYIEMKLVNNIEYMFCPHKHSKINYSDKGWGVNKCDKQPFKLKET